MVHTRSKGPPVTDQPTDPEGLIRAANARKRKAAAEADGLPKAKKPKAAPAKKRKKAKASGRKKKTVKSKTVQTIQDTDTATDQQPGNETPAPTDPQQDGLPAQVAQSAIEQTSDAPSNQQDVNAQSTSEEVSAPVPDPFPAPSLSPNLQPQRLLSATPEPRYDDDFGSLFGESPAPTRSQTPEGNKKAGEEELETSHHSTPPPPYTPVDPRSTCSGKTMPGYSGKSLPGQRRPMAAKQPRQNLLTTVDTAPAQTEAITSNPASSGSQVQSRATSAEDTSEGSGLSAELERALNDRSTPSVNNQGSAAATVFPEQPQGQDASSTPGPNHVVQSTEMARTVNINSSLAQSTSPTSSTSSIRSGILLTEEQRRNPGAAWREGLQRWRQSAQTAAARPGVPALANPMPMTTDWLNDDQVTRAIASVSEAVSMRDGSDRAMLGTVAMGRLENYDRTLSSYTHDEQRDFGHNDFYGPRREWILPIARNFHWYLAHVRLGPPGVVNVEVYDSSRAIWSERRQTVREWIRNSGWYADGQPPYNDINVTRGRSVQQDGGWECGRFTVLNAWALMLGMTPTNARPPHQRVWRDVDEIMNLAMQGHMDAATIEALLLDLGVANGRMTNTVAFNRTRPFRSAASLDNELVIRAQAGVPVGNGQIRRHAAIQQGLDLSRATPEQTRQAHEQLVNDVEASLQNRDLFDRSTPEVDGDMLTLLSHALQTSPDKLPTSQADRINLFRRVRTQIRAKAQEEHPSPPGGQSPNKPKPKSNPADAADEEEEDFVEQLINEIDVMSAAAAILDEPMPENGELLTVLSNLTGCTREEMALLSDAELEDIFEAAADKRRTLLSSSPDAILPEDSEWSFGSMLEGTLPLSSPSVHVNGLWEPGDPLPPDESLTSCSPLLDNGTASQNSSEDDVAEDGGSKDDSTKDSDSKDESSKNNGGSNDLEDQPDIGF